MACDPATTITSAELTGLNSDIQTIDDVVDSSLDTTTTKNGKTINTLLGQLKLLGYLPPVTYAGAIAFGSSDNTKTIDRNGIIYAPKPSELPFTTSGTWTADDENKFFVIQGIFSSDLGYTPSTNSVADLIALDAIAGQRVTTKGYYEKGDGGGAEYLIKTALEYGGTPDGYADILLANGNIAVLQMKKHAFPPQFGVRADGTDPGNTNHVAIQAILNKGVKNIYFGGAENDYLFNGPFGLPDQGFYQEEAYYLTGNGAKVRAESPTALITSKTIADNNGIGTGVEAFAGKIFISGLSFLGTAAGGVVDGDFLYNVHFTRNHCYALSVVAKSFQTKGIYPDGYFQSIYMNNNTFVSCNRIMDGKRGFNIVFTDNMCEGCTGGLYIDGNGQPALNNIRVRDNVFEGGGVFGSFGDALGGILEGNYIESNTTGDIPTKKCHFDLSYKGGSQFYDWRIARNTAQDPASQVSDVDFQMASFDGASTSAEFLSVLLEGNWTTSRVTNFTPIKNAVANRQGDRQNEYNMPNTPHDAKIDFISSFQDRLVSTNLIAGEFRIATIDIPDGNMQNLDLALDLNVLMKGRTAGGVTTCCANAGIKVLISASGSGVSASRLPTIHSVEAGLVSYVQQPNGTEIDTVGPYNGTILFNAPAISVDRVGTKVHILLSNWSAASTPNYGAVNSVQTYITASAFSLTTNPNSAAKWIDFTQ